LAQAAILKRKEVSIWHTSALTKLYNPLTDSLLPFSVQFPLNVWSYASLRHRFAKTSTEGASNEENFGRHRPKRMRAGESGSAATHWLVKRPGPGRVGRRDCRRDGHGNRFQRPSEERCNQ